MSLIDNKQSLLVEKQLPDFVKEDYPTFIRFMEAYYEFLENKLGTQKNDLNYKARKLYSISDIDENLVEFEEYFFKTFLELFPRDTLASKSLLIKNSIPLYLSKGNEKSIKYFFRALFDEEVDVRIPRNDVLLASGGNWKITKVVRALPQVYAKYISGVSKFDGVASNTKFYLPQECTLDDVSVFIDGALQTPNLWQLDNAIYSGKKFELPYVTPTQIKFKPDGTELFVLDDTNNIIYKHSLSDAWNIQSVSTSAIQQSPALTTFGITTSVVGLDIKPEGDRIYFGQFDAGNNRIIECQFQDAWNLQTLSSQFTYNANVTSILNGQSIVADSGLRDVKFDTSGANVYVVNSTTDRVYQFRLSTPWQVNTASFVGQLATTGEVNATGIHFKPDGTLFYLTGDTDTIRSFNISNTWNISDSTLDKVFTPSVGEATSYMLTVKPEGDILYYGGQATNDIFQFDLPPDYFIQKEYKKITFPKSVATNSEIRVVYNSFDPELLKNRKITGNTSGAAGIVEAVFAYNNEGTDILEFEISDRTTTDTFINGESFKTDVLDKNDNPIELFLEGYSGLQTINIINEGSSYNVGDPIILIGGEFTQEANAAVSKVFSGLLNRFTINYGGAGFASGNSISIFDKRTYSISSVTATPGSVANQNLNLTFTGGTALVPANVRIFTLTTGAAASPIANIAIYDPGIYTSPPTGITPLTGGVNSATFMFTIGFGAANANGAIVDINKTGLYSPNTYSFNTDIIYDAATTLIGFANLKVDKVFLNCPLQSPNATNRLIDVLSYADFTNLGSIESAIILDSSLTAPNSSFFVSDASSPSMRIVSGKGSNSVQNLVSMGSIGRVDIINKGSGYKIGDKLRFVPILGITNGIGCAAAVNGIDSSGGITSIQFQPVPPTSNCLDVSVQAGSNTIIGNNSTFLVDGFATGRDVIVFNQRRTISQIVSNTIMNVTTNFTATKQNTEIGLYNSLPIGGIGYEMHRLPNIIVESTTGVGAELLTSAIMGDGENLLLTSNKKSGGIEEIQIFDKGVGYRATPLIIMTDSGDGQAVLEAVINNSYFEYEGRYLNNDSLLSSEKKLQDSTLFNTGSYIIKTKQQFSKYKESFLKLLHPAGTALYNEYTPEESNVFSKIISNSPIATSIEITTP